MEDENEKSNGKKAQDSETCLSYGKGDETEEEGSCSSEDSYTYHPSLPNVLEIVQSQAPPGVTFTQGQSEVITSAGGKRFVAQFFEESADTRETVNANTTTNAFPTDDQMARALCVNLLGELVKGSCQLAKNKLDHGAANSFQHMMENGSANMKKEMGEYFQSSDSDGSDSSSGSKHSLAFDSLQMECENEENIGLVECRERDSDQDSVANIPFKKARHSSDIKCSHQNSEMPGACVQDVVETSSSQKDGVRDRKRIMTNAAGDDRDQSDVTGGTLVGKRQKLAQSESESESECELDGLKNTEVEDESGNRTGECGNFDEIVNDSVSNQGDTSIQDNEMAEEQNDEISLTYLEKWQNHHIAKAIVDNAINKTLDEMALGPQEREQRRAAAANSSSAFTRQRQHIVDAGVSEVISQRGLRSQRHSEAQSQQSALHPFIKQLTEVTEDIFVETLGAHARFSASFNLTTTSDNPAETASQTPQTQGTHQSAGVHSYTLTHAKGGHGGNVDSQTVTNKASSDRYETHEGESPRLREEKRVDKELFDDKSPFSVQFNTSFTHQTHSHCVQGESPGVAPETTTLDATTGGLEQSPKQYVLDQAMEAVINEKGLKL